jgi:hypothetical protein
MLPCNYEEDKNKVPMNKPYNIQNTNICNGIFHISFFKALLINEGETTRGEKGIGANGNRGETTRGANGIRGETDRHDHY